MNEKIRRAVDQTIEVLNRRVNDLGTTEPNIQRVGDDRILVEVPGLQDTNRLKEIVGTTAKLEFRLVADPGANPGAKRVCQPFNGDFNLIRAEPQPVTASPDPARLAAAFRVASGSMS